MIQHILVGVDGSPSSVDAARYAMGLAEQTKAKLTFAFVIETPQVIPVGPLSGYMTTSNSTSDEDLRRGEAMVQALAKEKPALEVVTRVDLGSPADVLCELVEQLKADLLVVGSRGHNAAQRFLIGSVSDRIVHHARCPVLVVRS
jgi:nucleotide-binding universal stress UspA family protein